MSCSVASPFFTNAAIDGNRQRIVVKAKLLQPVLDLMAHADNDVIRAASNAAFNILLTEDGTA